jgi:UDP-N-acetylglucosamine 2-epimerase (non-hydrolysing)
MPEEINRVLTDRVSDYLFAPSADAVDNLRAEGCGEDQIFFVGNVMVDTMLANAEHVRRSQVLARLDLEPHHYGLVTLHRPPNVDDPETLGDLLTAFARLAEDIPLVFPAHPRTRPRVEEIGTPNGVRLIQPVGYLDFLALEEGAALVLTDSGGVQEETTVFGVPCLTLRENTERPVTVTDGTNTVVGTDPGRIVEEARRALEEKPRVRRPPRWDGHAAERIAEVLVEGKRRAGLSLPTKRASLAR